MPNTLKPDLDALERANLGKVVRPEDWMAVLAYARELERRVELRSMLLREQTDRLGAANLRIIELESASQPGGGAAENAIKGPLRHGKCVHGITMSEHCENCAKDGFQTEALRDVMAERHRQVVVHGFEPYHDDEHSGFELAIAASCYAIYTTSLYPPNNPPPEWPWPPASWKPKDDRQNFVRAAALLLAEIERIDRAAPSAGNGGAEGGGNAA